ncbi:HpcH/HpaI aldolase family protein [Prauserella muralis]|uniref:Aldolase n=1 Tax=Prauserella muralis TaxID=588067 RepID=A0A2V4B1G8_9PSEU|nr:aldolase/citrate lyase family protein [Prauserella muralis]PXY27832.1 aldolase [Prauserella muralis]TWE22405.1 4-hydroxy-2-oxoheptanedioate aldolase [Prauserella muralis]
MTALEFARRLRGRQRTIGYWVVLDDPVATERLARLGYDYVAIDAQHGLLGYEGVRNGILAIDAGNQAAAVVRVEQNDPFAIGRVLDAGATGVIVPLVDDVEGAERAVAATRYPPRGRRSYGPMRAQLRVGPAPAEADEAVVCLAMIETPEGLRNVERICAVDGLDGVYVGPSDLRLAVGGSTSTDPAVDEVFEDAVRHIAEVARAGGVAAGIHTPDGATAARRLAQGYTFATVASDLVHLQQAALSHLETARRNA